MTQELEIIFQAGVEYKEKLYVSARYMNALFEYDLITQKTRYICSFDEEIFQDLHWRAILLGNEAWFIPKEGEYIAIVNLDTFQTEYLKVVYKERKVKGTSVKYYSGGVIANQYVYLCPTSVDTLLVIDAQTREIYDYYIKKEDDECYGFAYYMDGKIHILGINEEHSIELDLKNHRAKKKKSIEKNIFGGVFLDKEEQKLWYAPGTSDYILYQDVCSNTQKKIKIKRDCAENVMLTCWITPYKDSLFFCGEMKDVIIRVHRDTEEVEYYRQSEDIDDLIYMPIESENYVILLRMNRDDGEFLIFDEQINSFQACKMKISNTELVRQIKESGGDLLQVCGEKIIENKMMGIDGFWGLCDNLKEQKKATIGKNIWKCLSRE